MGTVDDMLDRHEENMRIGRIEQLTDYSKDAWQGNRHNLPTSNQAYLWNDGIYRTEPQPKHIVVESILQVERLARALNEFSSYSQSKALPWDHLQDSWQERYREKARAMIEYMEGLG